MASWYHLDGDAVILTVHVQPGAKRSGTAGLHGNALKIRLVAPPVEGRANQALLRFMAELFDVPLRNVELVHGAQSRHKIVKISGVAAMPEGLAESATAAE